MSLAEQDVVKRAASIVSEIAGIQLGPKQYSMVESRLKSRMVKLQLETLDQYLQYLTTHAEQESQALLSLLTTHHTFFFREFGHFEYLLNQGLPVLLERARARGDKKIRIWSAAASRGQEVYSLAMFMNFHLKAVAPDIDFEVWGTDVDPESIEFAKNGVYRASELKQAPAMYVDGHWVRGKGNVKEYSKVKSNIKDKCHFEVSNLLSPSAFLTDKSFDVIFCRNVFIYFDSQQIQKSTASMLKHLDSDGFLILGVSETLNGMNLPVSTNSPSVYRHAQKKEGGAGVVRPKPVAPAPVQQVLKVLSIDDSPAILALLKKILGSGSGFEVVATAKNGLEGLEVLKRQKVDLITLDLHMPEMDGMGFLAAYKEREAPVVIVSSINRDDASIAQKAIALGAADYVEKPSLENVAQATNEIRAKLKTVYNLKKQNLGGDVRKENQKVKAGKKKVLIVDDSPAIHQLLEKIISADPDLEVIAKADRPSQVEALITAHSPDVITMDINMPEMDGVQLLQKLHTKYYIPTVMISSISREEGPQVLKALEIGAVDYIQKPEMSSISTVAPMIREKIKQAASSNIRRRTGLKRKARQIANLDGQSLVLMGASTGGTEAIREVLESMPSKIPPILIVQHIPAGFSAAFAKRLNDILPFEVKEGADGDEVKPNRVLIAPGGQQMGLRVVGGKLFIRVDDSPAVNRHKPSVDFLFQSAQRLGLSRVVAVLMTGMGADGARGLKDLKLNGIRTIAQDEASCVVFGMPREAIALGAAEFIKPLNSIAETIVDLVEQKSNQTRPSKIA